MIGVASRDEVFTATECAERDVFRDTWIAVGDRWKVKARQQTGPTKVLVDKPEYEP
ncbi:MAG: hypothetical protein ABJA98_10905 [Acidobacteriota bacterium]